MTGIMDKLERPGRLKKIAAEVEQLLIDQEGVVKTERPKSAWKSGCRKPKFTSLGDDDLDPFSEMEIKDYDEPENDTKTEKLNLTTSVKSRLQTYSKNIKEKLNDEKQNFHFHKETLNGVAPKRNQNQLNAAKCASPQSLNTNYENSTFFSYVVENPYQGFVSKDLSLRRKKKMLPWDTNCMTSDGKKKILLNDYNTARMSFNVRKSGNEDEKNFQSLNCQIHQQFKDLKITQAVVPNASRQTSTSASYKYKQGYKYRQKLAPMTENTRNETRKQNSVFESRQEVIEPIICHKGHNLRLRHEATKHVTGEKKNGVVGNKSIGMCHAAKRFEQPTETEKKNQKDLDGKCQSELLKSSPLSLDLLSTESKSKQSSFNQTLTKKSSLNFVCCSEIVKK